MDFMTAVKTCFSKYVTFEGRASRSEYWWFILFILIGQVVLLFVFEPLSLIFLLAVLLPNLAVVVRRLHDVDKSGWWYLIFLVPLIGGLLLLYWFVTEGTRGPNQYGPDPLGGTSGGGDVSYDDDSYRQSSIPRVDS